jgi:hypothetical protein
MYILVKIPMSSFFFAGTSRKSHNVAGEKAGRKKKLIKKSRVIFSSPGSLFIEF